MKNQIYLLAFILIYSSFIFTSCSDKNTRDNQRKESTGKNISSITASVYDASQKFEKILIGELREKNIYKYSENGSILEELSYNSKGKLSDSIIYKYDKKGNEIEKNDFNTNGELTYNYIKKYNGNGKEIESTTYNWGRIVSKHTYRYDKNGNEIESTHFSDDSYTKYISKYENGYLKEVLHFIDGESIYITRYECDENGNKLKTITYDHPDGYITVINTYKYNENGNSNETKLFDPDGYLTNIDTEQYDENGKLIKHFWRNLRHKTKFLRTYTYHENGNLDEQNTFDTNRDGIFKHKSTIKCDKYGNTIEAIFEDEDELYKYTYEFDKNDNWIKKISFKNNKPSRIVKRVIEYY